MSTQHTSKRTKLNDDSPQIIISGYNSSVDVPNNVTHVQFHPSVTEVGNETFKGCSQLREVILNDCLREIGEEAFADCKSLERIAVPSTVVKIDGNAFSGCFRLREVVLNQGITQIGKYAFHGCSSLRRIVIPSTVGDIDSSSFQGCANLLEVELNEGIKRINKNAFMGCSSLEVITLPSTLTEIGVGTFIDCTSLREISIHNEDMKIGDNAFHWTTTHIGAELHHSLVLEQIKFPSITTRLDVIKNENEDEAKEIIKVINFICKHGGGPGANINHLMRLSGIATDGRLVLERRGNEILVSPIALGNGAYWKLIQKKLLYPIVHLITCHEKKEATALFELALWKTKMDQANANPSNREAYRVEVPGPIKDAILQYAFPPQRSVGLVMHPTYNVIFIRFLNGRVITCDAEPSDTIIAIKQKVQDKQGIPALRQCLIFAGAELEDTRTLSDYNIHMESNIHIVIAVPNQAP